MKKGIIYAIILQISFFISPLSANNITVSDVIHDIAQNTLSFDLSWDNGFNLPAPSPYNYQDLAYIFIKYKNSNGTTWEHMPVQFDGHSTDSPPPLLFSTYLLGAELPDLEQVGLITLYNAWNTSFDFVSGSISVRCTVALSENVPLLNPSFKVFAIEMINSTKTSGVDFYLGDGVSNNRFHKGNDSNEPYLYSGGNVDVGTGAGDINVNGNPLPVSVIPTSYIDKLSYAMKYEITQEQYVDFLNCLNRVSQNEHTGTDISGTSVTNRFVMSNTTTAVGRNGIRCDATLPSGGSINLYCDLNGNGILNENDDGQNLAANYLLPKDLLAYLDWAGLSPINEIEYEFLCRGTQVPVPNEYAWGSDMKTAAIIEPVGADGPNETLTNIGSNGIFRRSNSPMRVGAAANQTTNRIQSGASICGIMELSGNAAELVIGTYSIEDFISVSDGDGTISILGLHNENWPNKLTMKGLAPNSSALNTVSHRHALDAEYVSNFIRSPLYGGRGQLR